MDFSEYRTQIPMMRVPDDWLFVADCQGWLVKYSVEKFKVERNKDIIHIKYQKKLWKKFTYFTVIITDTNNIIKTMNGVSKIFFFNIFFFI